MIGRILTDIFERQAWIKPLNFGVQSVIRFSLIIIIATVMSTIITAMATASPTPIQSKTQPQDKAYISEACLSEGIETLAFKNQGDQAWQLTTDFSQYEGQTIGEVILHCTLPQCENKIAKAEILRSIQVPIYQKITAKDLVSTWSRMMALGLFESDSFFILERELLAVENEPLTLRVCALSATIIESIEVHYKSWTSTLYPKQFLSEIHKRLNLKRGGRLPKDIHLLKQQKKQIEASYTRLGYQGVHVELIPIYLDQNKQRAILEIHVKEGQRPFLGPPLIELLDQGLDQSKVKEAHRRITRTITSDLFYDLFKDFFSLFGIGHYDRRATRQRADKLEQELRDEGWVSARVKVIGDKLISKKMSPEISLRLGPKLIVDFEGNNALRDRELVSELTFKESGVIDEIELEASRQNLINRYKSASYYFVRITATLSVDNEHQVHAQFKVDEGPQVYLGKVIIRGVTTKHRETLGQVMQTKGVAPNGVIGTLRSSSGILQEAKVNQDLKSIIKRYRSLGYSQVSLRCAPSQKTSIFDRSSRSRRERFDLWSTDVNRHRCYRVNPDHLDRDQRHLLTLLIEVNEGQQTRLNFVDFYPFDQSMDEQTRDDKLNLLKGLELVDELNQPITEAGFSQDKLNLLNNFLTLLLKEQGYLRAKVQPLCQLKASKTTLTKPQPCKLEALYGMVIERLSFKADLGPKAEVNGLIIHGQLLTQEEVLRREILLKSGSPLSADALLLSQSNLRALGLFRSVNIKPIGLGVAPQGSLVEPVTLVLNVEENLPWLLDGYFGLRLTDQAVTTDLEGLNLLYTSALTLRHRNVNGKGWELGGGVSHDNLLLNPTDLEGDNSSWAVGPFFKNPRLFDTYAQLFTEVIFEQRLSGQRTSYFQRLRGKGTLSYNFYNLSFPRRWGQGLTFELELEAKLERQRPLSRYSERRAFTEPTPSFNVAPTIVYDQRDNPIHPTRGFYLTVGVDFLGSQDLFEGVVSYKETLNAQWVGGWFKKRLLFVPSLKLGAVQSALTDTQLTVSNADFLFTAGGDGVIYPVRGYPAAVINTCTALKRSQGQCQTLTTDFTPDPSDLINFAGRAIINMNVEARFPSFLLSNLWLAIFGDMGAVSDGIKSLDLSMLYPSIGGGIRYLLPGQVPLRFDVAYPLRETAFSTKSLGYHFNFFYVL